MSLLISRANALFMISLVVVASMTTIMADEEGLQFFEQKIRPVLPQHYYGYHSVEGQSQKKLQAGLFLTQQLELLPVETPGLLW